MNTLLENLIPLVVIVIIIWLAALTYFLFSYLRERRRVAKEIKSKGLQESIEKILLDQTQIENKIRELQENDNSIGNLAAKSITKIGAIRYNPFSDTGGDQSFSVALLNLDNNGIVITSLYNREGSRVYAKSVSQGQSKYHLTEEEKEAINKAKDAKK